MSFLKIVLNILIVKIRSCHKLMLGFTSQPYCFRLMSHKSFEVFVNGCSCVDGKITTIFDLSHVVFENSSKCFDVGAGV